MLSQSQDLKFNLDYIAKFSELCQLQEFSHLTPDILDPIIDSATKLAQDVIAPLNKIGDQKGAILVSPTHVKMPDGFKQAYEAYCENGWNSLPFDTEFGGQKLPWAVTLAVQEIWQSANMGFALCSILTQGTIELFLTHGTESQKQTYLPNLISGKWTGTMNLTESQAGSDVGALSTKATKQADHYLIKGQKIFISYGEHDYTDNIIHMVLARTATAPEGTAGVSLFIVPKILQDRERNDIKCIHLEHKMGLHASPTCVLAFGEDQGAVGYLFGEENRGLEYMFTMMNNARISVGIQGIGIANRSYERALEFSNTRIQSKKINNPKGPSVPIIEHMDVRRMLLDMKALTEASRSLAILAGYYLDLAKSAPDESERQKAQNYIDLLTPIVKAWGTDIGCEVSSLGVQIHGGMGYIEETGASQHYRDVRVSAIYEGTNGIQANDLTFRKTIRNQGKVAQDFITEMDELCKSISGNSALSRFAGQLSVSNDTLGKAVKHIITSAEKDVELAAAMAYPYLNLWGCSAGGYVMLQQGKQAELLLSQSQDKYSQEFLLGKINTCLYYGDSILAKSQSYAGQIFNAAQSLTQFKTQWF